MERTLILVKPDAFARGLTGEIIARFERKGLKIVAMKHMTVSNELAEEHYARAPRQAVLRRPRRVHHRRPARRARARGARGGQGGAPGDRRDQPDRGGARLDPRRLRARGPDEPRPRLRLERVVRARDRALLPRARELTRVLVLASRSPRRRAILEQLGVEFRVEPPDVEELSAGDPRAIVRENALRKARAVEGERVLGVDTAVVLDGEAFGKPRDAAGGRERPASAVGARPRGDERHRDERGRQRGERRGRHARPLPRARRARRSPGTWARGSGRTPPAATRSRAREPRSSRRSRATTGTSSACPSRCCWRWSRTCSADAAFCSHFVASDTHGRGPAPLPQAETRRLDWCTPAGGVAGAVPERGAGPVCFRLGAYPHLHSANGLFLVSHRDGRPRHGRRSRDRQHARLRARSRHRALRAVGGRDRLADQRGARGGDRGQADARPHARARSRRSAR